MLSLGRNPGEYIVIGDNIIVKVLSVNGNIRLAIDAPKHLKIVRGEAYEQDHPVPKAILQSKNKDSN